MAALGMLLKEVQNKSPLRFKFLKDQVSFISLCHHGDNVDRRPTAFELRSHQFLESIDFKKLLTRAYDLEDVYKIKMQDIADEYEKYNYWKEQPYAVSFLNNKTTKNIFKREARLFSRLND